METKPDFTYSVTFIELPYEETLIRLRGWSKRLQAKTGKRIFYRLAANKIDIWHNGLDSKQHNTAARSLTRIIDRQLGLANKIKPK